MPNPPLSVAITRGLILAGALIWLLLAVLLALNAHPAFPDDPLIRNVMAVASLVAGCDLVLLTLLRQRRRLAYFGMLAALALSALFFIDDVGLVDLLFLAITIIPSGLLIRDRRWYLRALERPMPAQARYH
jgi:hypothetical protein